MSVVDYILNRDENGMVRYLYGKDKRYPYVGKCKWDSARWMLENDKKREIRMSEEFEGFPLTADGVYFFDGAVSVGESEGEATSSVSEQSSEPPSPEPAASLPGEGLDGDGGAGAAATPRSKSFRAEEMTDAPGCGPDWCEIPEAAEKPKRKKRRAKDVVCE